MHSISPNICIERLGKNNISSLGILFREVHGRKIPVNYFENKYDTRYTGINHLGFIAFNHNRMPIAFYGVIPCYLRCDGDVMLAAQSTDTMTHPSFRNQGLFVKLAEMTVELCKKNELRLLFGFPNQHSLPGFVNKLGWEEREQMECFIIPVKASFIGRLLKKFPLSKDLYIRYQKWVLKKHANAITDKPNSLFSNANSGVFRSSEYISYKQYNKRWFLQFPNAFVWLKVGDGLIIGDMVVEQKNFDDLMERLCSIAQEMGLGKVVFHCTKNAQLHALFAARCIPVPSFPVIYKNLAADIVPDFAFTYADVDTF